MGAYLNIAAIRECTVSEGPGKRFAIWCQGCMKRCPGCCNPEMQPIEKRHIVSVADVLVLISRASEKYDIEGISLIGGEPFLQAESLADLAKGTHAMGLSVLVFSGYTSEEIASSNADGWSDFFNEIDVLIDGPYIQERPDLNRGWVGSENQRVLFLTNRYAPGIELSSDNTVEVLVGYDDLLFNGWPVV